MTTFTSTRGHGPVSFAEALAQGLAPDGGLYVPLSDAQLGPPPPSLPMTFMASALWTATGMLPDIASVRLERIVNGAFDFEVPLVEIAPGKHVLELFHGPSHAFKDFGARFMARAMHELLDRTRLRTILVATSGDTGGAVAAAFQGLDRYRVVVLFPKSGVSDRQRRQMTTLGGNVVAVAVDGTFDDCQRLAKSALTDPVLRIAHGLTSANSINIGRLIPQSFYYVHSVRTLGWGSGARFAVPSGNLGDLCAGLLAYQAGMPASGFLAASNQNDVFPKFLADGVFVPRASVPTRSNAMDVGDPSNLERIRWMYPDHAVLTGLVRGATVSDAETVACIADVYQRTGYVLDPHTAVAFRAMERHHDPSVGPVVVVATAHPAKFPETVTAAIGVEPPLPASLARAMDHEENYLSMSPEFPALRALLESLS